MSLFLFDVICCLLSPFSTSAPAKLLSRCTSDGPEGSSSSNQSSSCLSSTVLLNISLSSLTVKAFLSYLHLHLVRFFFPTTGFMVTNQEFCIVCTLLPLCAIVIITWNWGNRASALFTEKHSLALARAHHSLHVFRQSVQALRLFLEVPIVHHVRPTSSSCRFTLDNCVFISSSLSLGVIRIVPPSVSALPTNLRLSIEASLHGVSVASISTWRSRPLVPITSLQVVREPHMFCAAIRSWLILKELPFRLHKGCQVQFYSSPFPWHSKSPTLHRKKKWKGKVTPKVFCTTASVMCTIILLYSKECIKISTCHQPKNIFLISHIHSWPPYCVANHTGIMPTSQTRRAFRPVNNFGARLNLIGLWRVEAQLQTYYVWNHQLERFLVKPLQLTFQFKGEFRGRIWRTFRFLILYGDGHLFLEKCFQYLGRPRSVDETNLYNSTKDDAKSSDYYQSKEGCSWSWYMREDVQRLCNHFTFNDM